MGTLRMTDDLNKRPSPKCRRGPAAALSPTHVLTLLAFFRVRCSRLPEVFFMMNFSSVRCRVNGCNKPYARRQISLIGEGLQSESLTDFAGYHGPIFTAVFTSAINCLIVHRACSDRHKWPADRAFFKASVSPHDRSRPRLQSVAIEGHFSTRFRSAARGHFGVVAP